MGKQTVSKYFRINYMFYLLILLAPIQRIHADYETYQYIVKIKTWDKSGNFDTLYASYYGVYPTTQPLKELSQKDNINNLLYVDFFGTSNTNKFSDSIFVTNTINYIDSIPYAVGYNIYKNNYRSITFDSMVIAESTRELQWVDSSTAKWLGSMKSISYYEVKLFDCDGAYKTVKVCAFDSLWSKAHFIAQFKNLKIKGITPQYKNANELLYEGLSLEYQNCSDSWTHSIFPVGIKNAIKNKKIFLVFKDEL